MGEILKAAGCSYDNGERSITLNSIFKFDINVKKVFSLNMDLNTFGVFLLFPAVVKTTVLLADMKDFNDVNDIYKQCKCH